MRIVSLSYHCTCIVFCRYGKGFGIVGLLVGEKSMLNTPNCITGALFFAMQLLLGMLNHYAIIVLYLNSSECTCGYLCRHV